MTQEENKTTEAFIKLEVIRGLAPNDYANKKVNFPHDGSFLIIRTDGVMSVATVVLGNNEDKENCQTFQECWIGAPEMMDAGNVMDCREVNVKMDAMRDRYEADLKIKQTELESNFNTKQAELEAEYEKKRIALEHEYEMKRLELEKEMPKRFEQGEWVSGKTLTDIIKTLTGNNSINKQN